MKPSMKPTHWILYFFCLPWDLTICWPFVCLIRLAVGTDLRWDWPPTGSSSYRQDGASP